MNDQQPADALREIDELKAILHDAEAAIFDLERRTGTDRRASTWGGGRRAADHKPATPDEVGRIVHHEILLEAKVDD